MVLMSTRLVPELQYYFSVFLRASTLNKYRVTYPAVLDCPCLDENKSFIRLLFDDNWPKSFKSYRYLYREETNKGSWPGDVRTRLALYPSSGECYLSDRDPPDANINLFNLQDDDLLMLDNLLEYRCEDSTATITIDYDSLSTNLSKMIFLYLDLKINGSYERYNNESLISDESSVLECFYEVYLGENMFNFRATHTVF